MNETPGSKRRFRREVRKVEAPRYPTLESFKLPLQRRRFLQQLFGAALGVVGFGLFGSGDAAADNDPLSSRERKPGKGKPGKGKPGKGKPGKSKPGKGKPGKGKPGKGKPGKGKPGKGKRRKKPLPDDLDGAFTLGAELDRVDWD